MNYSYIRYSVLSLLFFSMVATTSCQTWSELFTQSYAQLDTLARSSIKTVQENNGIVAAKEFATKNPIVSALCVLVTSYGLYRILRPSKVAKPNEEELLCAVHAKATQDIKDRLGNTLTKMDFAKDVYLELYLNQLHAFKYEIETQYAQNIDAQSIKPLVQDLINSLNAYMSLKGEQGVNKDELLDTLNISYVTLQSIVE